jgi:hypothetical protein
MRLDIAFDADEGDDEGDDRSADLSPLFSFFSPGINDLRMLLALE